MTHDMDSGPRRRVVERPVTLESHAERLVPVAVCPRKLKLVSIEACGACESFAGLCINPEGRPPFLRCSFEEGAGEVRATVSDAMTHLARSVTLDAPLDQVREYFRAYGPAVPVIDVEGRAAGLLTRADVTECLLARPGASLRVGDIEVPAAFMVAAEEPLAYVAAVMAYERVHYVIVIDSDRRVVGLVDALDIARWFACRSGYIVPGGYDTGR